MQKYKKTEKHKNIIYFFYDKHLNYLNVPQNDSHFFKDTGILINHNSQAPLEFCSM